MGNGIDAQKRAQVLGTISFLEKEKIPYFKSRVFEHFGVSRRHGWEIVRQLRNRPGLQDDPNLPDPEETRIETRGRKKILRADDITTMERLIWQYGFEGRVVSWEALAREAGVTAEASRRTVRRTLDTLGHRKCVACRTGWVSPAIAKKRLEAATVALRERPTPQQWRDIRWSEAVHFGLGPEGQIMAIRKPGQRHCPNCVPEAQEPEPKHVKEVHVWAALGWNFKSELYFFEVPGKNTNGKMTMQIYRDELLKNAVGPWLASGDRFVLAEEGDPAHGTGKHNIVRDWKQDHQLNYFFNTPGSPDLSPIDNAWNAITQYLVKFTVKTEEELRGLMIEAWKARSQDWINRLVDSMVQRMQDVVQGEGRMTGH
ncbi:hypothetical protein CHGG_07473 [Chaetomium globosum CBS 148.51]|uniref:Tc1-like transposase DDE domain-containing protein n=1 Tax=Chaetomium globosum (strain ATCC 6205 / CBS 148.51 / DSM 1962 / NBRC 6347 / NRRL 1970) TaxID=306901 RepID=Q2GX31_CHAGB|nr:uncharacterized protein CHGG_07473 [Chaetomium globosum CBS 148.51]EAQ86220.1 hypothetical protein CHGG_07473 [Chaetomium globosum CBS 148.51]